MPRCVHALLQIGGQFGFFPGAAFPADQQHMVHRRHGGQCGGQLFLLVGGQQLDIAHDDQPAAAQKGQRLRQREDFIRARGQPVAFRLLRASPPPPPSVR